MPYSSSPQSSRLARVRTVLAEELGSSSTEFVIVLPTVLLVLALLSSVMQLSLEKVQLQQSVTAAVQTRDLAKASSVLKQQWPELALRFESLGALSCVEATLPRKRNWLSQTAGFSVSAKACFAY